MRTATLLAGAFATLLTSAVTAQQVPEGIHSTPKGPSKLCGPTATTAAEFEAQVAALPNIIGEAGTDRYKIYADEARFTMWAIAREGNIAYPLVTCGEVVKNG